MAEALIGPVVENLISLARGEFATISGINKKTEELAKTLNIMKAVLEDAEEKQMTDGSVKEWLQQLRDAVYVLDDILDECSIQFHRFGCLSSFNSKNIMFRHSVGNRLKEITRKLDRIASDKNILPLREGVRERSREVAEWRQTSSIIDQPQVYGRDGDKEKIVEFLLGQVCSSDFLSIYPIVGLGGVGKTTLAQLVYNDERVSNHFHIKIWVCVSENFSVEKILRSIIESITREKFDISVLDVIEKKVQELLERKSYLLVLDDVWNRTHELEFGLSQDKWNKLKSVLSCGSKGASVLVSTRDMDVARIMGTCQAHPLSCLSDDDCWLLFKQYAFGPDKEEHAELVAIGKEIVKKCGGLPLAAQALGGLLRTKNEEKEWLEVMESSLWNLPDGNSILPALRLSYFYLTPTLKQCFAFCAIFPKDKRIRKEDLIHLWMANGFISARENLDVEDVGNNIWKELCQKSFFQDIEKDDDSGNISFQMHDLVHDVAQSVMGQECMILKDVSTTDLQKNTHHIAFTGGDKFNKQFFKKVESLRTLYGLSPCSICSIRIPKNCSLHVLRIQCSKLPSFKNLFHLRYLELGAPFHSKIKTLPNSICSLRKLEILKLHGFSELECLPKHMSCLQNLRQLVINDGRSLRRMFPNIGKLSCLRTLSVYIVSLEQGHSLAELQKLKLGGRLKIKALNNVRTRREAQEANLSGKKDLLELHLCCDFTEDEDKFNSTHHKQVFEGLQPHSNLKKLTIAGYDGFCLPGWAGNLNNLVDLKFIFCRCEQLTSLGKLPCLRKLAISSMDRVKYIDDDEECCDGVEVKAFPALRELSLYQLPKLEKLLKAERGDMFPSLSNLEISGCSELVLPCLPSVERLTVSGCYNDELLRSISNCSRLTSLLLGYGSLTSFPEGMWKNFSHLKNLKLADIKELKELSYELFHLKALECLEISQCYELECLPEQVWEGLRSLRTLRLCGCKALRSLSEGIHHLTLLECLEIEYCYTLECLSEQVWEGLRSLRTLRIRGYQALQSLSEGIQHLTLLECLEIGYCDTLECLPEQVWEGLRSLRSLCICSCKALRSLSEGIHHLTLLERLDIVYCDVLECLPEQVWEGLCSLQTLRISGCKGLRSLPDGVRQLALLKRLEIGDCPTLVERCQKETGEDWDKIAHVPSLLLY